MWPNAKKITLAHWVAKHIITNKYNKIANNMKVKEIFCIYKTDKHHSHGSKSLLGLATTFTKAVAICELQAKKEQNKLDPDQLFNLKEYKQTQGYTGEGEFYIESNPINTLL
jgi:hypothetical protein